MSRVKLIEDDHCRQENSIISLTRTARYRDASEPSHHAHALHRYWPGFGGNFKVQPESSS